MRFFHITRLRNIESILSLGIIPDYRKGLTLKREPWKKVFVTNDPERIIRTQGGKAWEKGIAVIEVEIDACEPHRYSAREPHTLSDFEFTTDKIPPENIVNVKKIP